jgi:hypothetical protein
MAPPLALWRREREARLASMQKAATSRAAKITFVMLEVVILL